MTLIITQTKIILPGKLLLAQKDFNFLIIFNLWLHLI